MDSAQGVVPVGEETGIGFEAGVESTFGEASSKVRILSFRCVAHGDDSLDAAVLRLSIASNEGPCIQVISSQSRPASVRDARN